MSSGANRLLDSKNVLEGNSQDALADKLTKDANEKVAAIKVIPCE